MALAGDFVVVKMTDAGGSLQTFANNDIVSVDPGLTYDQLDVTGFGNEAHSTLLGQLQAPVTVRGYLTTTPMVGTHTVIKGSYVKGNQVTLRVAVGNNATPVVGVDPEYSGTFLVESYQQTIEDGKAVMFTATLKPATGIAPVWGPMAS